MSAIKRNLLIEQGATGPTPSLFTWHNPRHVFKVTTAGTSGAVEPAWPTGNCDCDSIVDNTVTWDCERVATESDWTNLSLWCPSIDYTLNAEIITPKEPIDLTGYTARMQIRDSDADNPDSVVLLDLSTSLDAQGNGIYLGGTAGTVEIVIQAEKTETFEWTDGEYDLELVSPTSGKYPNGFVTRFLQGLVTVTKERTR